MKTLIITILVLALGAGAFISRPSEGNFRHFIKVKFGATVQKDLAGKALDKIAEKLTGEKAGDKADAFLKDCTYNNRFLWADIEYKGKTIYTGVFNKWFEREKFE
jgi:hypothetical protein